MTKLVVVPLAALALAMTTLAQESGSASQSAQNAPPVEVWSARPGVGSAKRTGTLTARVNAVDADNRLLSIESAQGRMQTIKVGDSVKRLNEIAPGDTITVKYEQKLTLEYQPEGAAPIEKSATASATRAPVGSPPSGTQGTQVRGTVTVVKVDPLFRVVTLQGEKGEKYRVKAGADIDLAKVKAGQRYLATYAETLAVKVEKSGAAIFGPGPAR